MNEILRNDLYAKILKKINSKAFNSLISKRLMRFDVMKLIFEFKGSDNFDIEVTKEYKTKC